MPCCRQKLPARNRTHPPDFIALHKPNESRSPILIPKRFSWIARASRVEYPGAFYHVINRGNADDDIFKSLILTSLKRLSEVIKNAA